MDEVMNLYNWSGIPDEYRWAAIDKDGQIGYYKTKPHGIIFAMWVWEPQCRAFGPFVDLDGINWEGTLRKRPDNALFEGVRDSQVDFRIADGLSL